MTRSNQAIRPVALPVNYEAIPDALKREHRWVAWRYQWNPHRSKWDKRPQGKTNGPTTWCSFERCPRDLDGIGFCLGDGWAGVDLDHCRDPNTGEVNGDVVLETLNSVGAYVEVSPSGTGLKAFFKAPRGGESETRGPLR